MYTVQYRKAIGNDDEKEEEWSEKILKNLTDSLAISNLDEATKYEVRAHYKLVDTNISSLRSKVRTFSTRKMKKPNPMRFHTNLQQLRIENEGQSVRVANTDNQVSLCLFGEIIDRKASKRTVFEVTFLVETNKYHVAFGFVTGSFSSFVMPPYDFPEAIICYCDGDFRKGSNVFSGSKPGFTFEAGDTIRMHIDCGKGIGKWWKEGAENQSIETSLPQKFGIGVAMNNTTGTCVRCTNYTTVQK